MEVWRAPAVASIIDTRGPHQGGGRARPRGLALKPRRSKHRSGQPMAEVKRTSQGSRAAAAILLGLLAAPGDDDGPQPGAESRTGQPGDRRVG